VTAVVGPPGDLMEMDTEWLRANREPVPLDNRGGGPRFRLEALVEA